MPSTLEKRNVALLLACQALVQTGSVVIITAGGLAGHMLAANKSLATLPISALMIGTMIATIPASLMMGRYGRRAGFVLGALFGATGAALAVVALIDHSFWLFCLAHVFCGLNLGFAQFYRFAAADAASGAFKSRAISYVLAGGVIAAIAGPNLVSFTKDIAASGVFVASYAAIALLYVVAAALITLLRIPSPAQEKVNEPARPLSEIMRQPVFIVALVGAAVGYGVMNLAMTATPLAMAGHHHSIGETATVIQWHVLGMFVPSFFTGTLIARFGAPKIMLAGIALLAGHLAIALSGNEFLYYLSALTLLGIGWNFSYIGGTTLLTEAYRPSEKAKVQGVNDFTIFGTVVITSLISGALLHGVGWVGVNLFAVPFLAVAGIVLIVFLQRRPGRSDLAAA